MALTRIQYENMSKEELIQELADVNSSFVSDINTKLSNLELKFNDFFSVTMLLQSCSSVKIPIY